MEVIFISWDIAYPKLDKKYKRKVAIWRADEEAFIVQLPHSYPIYN